MPPSTLAARPPRTLVHAIGIAGAIAIFVVDLTQPLEHAVGMLYTLVIVLGLWTDWRGYPIIAALASCVLTAADVAFNWTSDPSPSTFVNPSLMVLLFMATASLVSRFTRLERRTSASMSQLEELRSALDAAAIVATTDVHGRITHANDKFCEISGYSREELIGQDHRIINSGLHSKEFIRHLWRTIASGRVWHGEIRNRAKNGRFYWVDTTIVPFLDQAGKPYRYIAIRADVTARKEAEARLMEQASLARVGQLAAVVAHEVKNPLAGVKAAVQMMMSRRVAGDAEFQVMREIVERVDALDELIGDLLTFARPRPLRLKWVHLRPTLEETVALLHRDPLAAAIHVDIYGAEATLKADPEQLKAALLNLLLNAAQAMGGHGRIAVAVRTSDDEAIINVRDTGPGIPEPLRARVFEPFFTTKSRGGGLGLPIARRTAELHGGSLILSAPQDGGAELTMRLPLQPPAPGPDDAAESGGTWAGPDAELSHEPRGDSDGRVAQ